MPSLNDLEQMLTAIGWNLKAVKTPTTSSNGRYVAVIEPPGGGDPISRDGETPERAVGNALMFAQRRNQIRTLASLGQKLAKWDTPWRDQLEDIAQAYADMPVFDDKAEQAWSNLARESKLQADAIRNQLAVQETDDPHPYKHHGEMIHDVHHNGKLAVSRAHAEHPVWTRDDLVNFRIAHDVLGHGQTGGDYGWEGENAAVAAHMPMLSPLARRALFTETLGKTAYAIRNGGHGYGPQKVGLLEDFLGPVEKANGEHVFVPHGKLVYPQNIMPLPVTQTEHTIDPATGIFRAASFKRSQELGVWTPEHTMDSMGSVPRIAYDSIDPSPEYPDILPGTKIDPNHYYQTPAKYTNPAITPAGHEDDYLNRGAMEENVGKFDQPEDPFVSLSPEEQRKTIRNSFAVVILSPKKSLTWNAAHYQAIKDLDSSATAADLFDAVMGERNYHNSFRAEGPARDMFDMEGLSPAGMNRANHDRTIKKLHDYIRRTTGHSDAKAWELSKKTIMEMFNEMEPHAMMALEKENEMRQQAIDPATQQVELNKGGRPNKKREIEPNGMRLRLKTWEMVNTWLDSVMQGYKIPRGQQQQELTPEAQPLGGGLPVQMSKAINGWLEKTAAEDGPNETTGADIKGRYGGVMFDHLEAIARLDQDKLERMRQYAVKDITEDHGKGFIFRAGCVALNIPGIGPKTASFAWLLIHPQTSELGIIDTHAARGLGFEDEKALNDRTYYIAERMQRGAKDATGYADMPQGKYHWGMWDMLRTPGVASDHRMLRPRNPLPWDDPSIYHGADEIVSRAGQPLYHGHSKFEASRPIMEAVKAEAQNELKTKMLPTHYAQGLLPEQPPDEYRADPIWKMMNRYTAPEWIDPATNLPRPEMTVPFEYPAVRAASVGWTESWAGENPNMMAPIPKLPGRDVMVPAGNGWQEAGPAPGDRKMCPHCGAGLKSGVRDWCHNCHRKIYTKTSGIDDEVQKLRGNGIEDFIAERTGQNPMDTHRELAYELEQTMGYDPQSAWTIAQHLVAQHGRGEGPGVTDMSQFENAGVADHTPVDDHSWGPTDEYPEDFNPNAPSADAHPLWKQLGWEPSKNQDEFDPEKAKALKQQREMPPFPEPTGETAPNTLGMTPEELEYYRKYKMPYDPNDPRTASWTEV